MTKSKSKIYQYIESKKNISSSKFNSDEILKIIKDYSENEIRISKKIVEFKNFLPQRTSWQNYDIGLDILFNYIKQFHPEIFIGNLNIVDVGPGIGCFMVICEAFGNNVYGEESVIFNDFTRACFEISKLWELKYINNGFNSYIKSKEYLIYNESSIDIFNFRGSIDSVMLQYKNNLFEATNKLLKILGYCLKPGGKVFISHNKGEIDDILISLLSKNNQNFYKVKNNNKRITELILIK